MIRRSTTTVAVAAAVGVAVLVGGSVAIATAVDAEDDAPDVPLTGDDLARAAAAALDHTGEGRVTDSEVGDEESYYEIEVTLDDGRQVDVQLDRAFDIVSTSSDDQTDDPDD
ncbi:hypothetical protein BH18ACT2_BH18ACT2_16720 [soil metagenome]